MDWYGKRELTTREWRVVQLVAKAMKNPEIAQVMGTTNNMVKNYLKVIFDKTGMNTRLELALWYVKLREERRTHGEHAGNVGAGVRGGVSAAVGSKAGGQRARAASAH